MGTFRYEAKAVCFHVNDIQVFMGRNSAGFKRTFYLSKMIFGRKSTFLVKFLFVALCDNFCVIQPIK